MALGLASLAGINLYLTVFVTGLAIRMDWVALSPALQDLSVLGDPIVLGVAGVLYVIECFADKIPWVDTAWDSVHTFIRPVGAAALAVATLGEAHPVFEIVAALLAGGVALTAHVAKAGTRLVANASPEPFSNVGLSLAEDGVVVAGLGLLAWNPIVALIVVLVFTGAVLLMLPKLLRGIRAKLWLAWRKLNYPPNDALTTVAGQRIPRRCELLLRRSHASTSVIECAAPCLSGGGPRLDANQKGWLVSLKDEPTLLFFVATGLFGGTVLEMDIAGATILHRAGFLCDTMEVTHKSGTPKHQFLFERGLTKVAESLAGQFRARAAELVAEVA